MAGMEELEIHSKSYLVRWVDVHAGHTISWSVKPDKKSINFGIFKYPRSDDGPTTTFPASNTYELPPTPGLRPMDLPREPQPSRNAQSTATEKLKSFGLQPVLWYGACEANRVSMGKYDVSQDSGGMYALVFDNTFSKQLSKKATFVLLTFPTNAAPQSTHHTHHIQGVLQESSPGSKEALHQGSSPNLQSSLNFARNSSPEISDKYAGSEQPHSHREHHETNGDTPKASFHTGALQKRRRKKHQGWARRFFSLDLTSGTLSYYHDRTTLALRGAVPLSVAAIGANAKTRQISIDSGAEVWHLKASSQKDFEAWKKALEQAKQRNGTELSAIRLDSDATKDGAVTHEDLQRSEWSRVESLLRALEKSREAARTLTRDTEPKDLSLASIKPNPLDRKESNAISGTSSNSGSPTERNTNGFFGSDTTCEGRRPFWKRKSSSDRPMPGMFKRSVSATPSLAPQKSILPVSDLPVSSSALESHLEGEIHEKCLSLLKDLDFVLSNFNDLILESKQRRGLIKPLTTSRYSIDSAGEDEFFDAEGYSNSQLLDIQHESEDESDVEPISEDDHAGSDSECEELGSKLEPQVHKNGIEAGFPARPMSLTPLPATAVIRRSTLPPSTMQPPSLIGFVRKNVGKDLSTIAMPVSANEPISLLQRASEALEYSELLDTASDVALPSIKRLAYVASFAISALSSSRVKERSIRKPFNPLLGETFELVREDRGFRFIGEKVTHRPVRIACQADAEKWSFSHSPAPTQKFWGKSAEIITEDQFRVVLHTTGDHFSWTPATCFLRNVLAGEKYIEPVGNMTIVNSSTGEKAVGSFKTGGMFSGRSEDVTVQLFNNVGTEEATGLSGKWTASLRITENDSVIANAKPVWSIGSLVQDSVKRYGFTTFAASLNEITAMEKAKLPPTDSRLRPDQRAAEEGDLQLAERAKAKLEEAQRSRRKVLEDTGTEYQPKWFEKVQKDGEGQDIWVLKNHGKNYWARREQGNWDGVANIFEHS